MVDLQAGPSFDTPHAFLARALYGLGQDDEAAELTRVSERAASADDVGSHVIWRGTRAKLLALLGDESAEELAAEAVTLARKTDFVNVQADALVDLAETMQLLERPDDALAVLEEALRLFATKGNLVSAASVERLLQEATAAQGVDRRPMR